MKVSLIAFDMDGTLLGKNTIVPEINRRALRECERRGIKLVFDSGRAYEELFSFAAQAGVKPVFAAANGARIEDESGNIRTITHSVDDSRKIMEILNETGAYYMACRRSQTYLFNRDEAKMLKKHHHLPGVYDYAGLKYEYVDGTGMTEIEDAYKFVVYGDDYDPRLDALREKMSGMGYSIMSSWRDNMEILPLGCDKGAALAFIAERFGVPREEIMAFGDNDNDLPMFAAAGMPVAMGSGEKCAMDAAMYIAGDNIDGGVGKFIYERVLL